MGLAYGINNSTGKISFENSCEILSKAFELGISTLDTAEAYGNAHQVIGEFHKLNPNIKFNIITKIPHDVDINKIEERVKTYIKDMNVDCLEVLMFHSFDSYKNNHQIIERLKSIKSQGLIKNIGVSIYTNEQIEALLLDDAISVVQMPFNLLDNESVRGELMQELKDKGKIVHTRSAFLQGLFFKESSDANAVCQELLSELIEIKSIAKGENLSISDLALGYCLRQKNIDQVLIGVDSILQLLDNVKSSNCILNQEVVNKINAIKVENSDLLNPSLWN
ncbi:hypothetical protein DB895_04375 [Flavobacterium psychrotolerans]|uniref:NADP-dependent oxidoreductase domain-containing protein n=2 Tax=Flavobacterium psychrotolerans TaxID=2169410 RepID=A0A2U1JMN5_9FLAO|nr:hypothetical protein DB895_04375 [Flavobacterium psychrotolerans]